MINKTNLPRVGDDANQKLTNAIEASLNALEAGVLANAVVLPPITFGAGSQRIFHGLGYTPKGYFVVKSSAFILVIDGPVETSDPQHFFWLGCSTPTTLTLAVF